MASITHATVATGTDAGNGEIRKAQWNEDHVLVGVPYVIAQSAVAVSVGAVTTEVVLATITVPANAMGPNGVVEVWATWTNNNNANNKTAYIRVGGTAGTIVYQNTNTTLVAVTRPLIFCNVNSATSQKTHASAFLGSGVGTSGAGSTTSTVTTSSAWDLVISGQKAVAGDTLTLEAYSVQVTYGA